MLPTPTMSVYVPILNFFNERIHWKRRNATWEPWRKHSKISYRVDGPAVGWSWWVTFHWSRRHSQVWFLLAWQETIHVRNRTLVGRQMEESMIDPSLDPRHHCEATDHADADSCTMFIANVQNVVGSKLFQIWNNCMPPKRQSFMSQYLWTTLGWPTGKVSSRHPARFGFGRVEEEPEMGTRRQEKPYGRIQQCW